tara:strand:+ start:1804 stop:3369 length:1566 start_codon:yes stop_codon:yes gene_type:complete
MKASGNPNLRTPIKHVVKSSGGLVTAQHWLAAQAGANALSNGANAIDAAVTAAFSLSVVEPWLSGIGGCGYMMIYSAKDQRVRTVNFGTKSPQQLNPLDYPIVHHNDDEWFNWPKVKDDRNLFGYPSICVPSFIAGLSMALECFGTISWQDAIAPAIEQAERGLPVDWFLSLSIAGESKGLGVFESTRKTFLPNGVVPVSGSVNDKSLLFFRPLAQTLRRLAQHGAQDFYHGKLARDIVADLQAGGNTMTLNDLSSYRAEIGEPLSLQYRDVTLHTAGIMTGGPGLMMAMDTLAQSNFYKKEFGSEAVLAQTTAIRKAYKDRLGQLDNDSCTSHVNVIDADGNIAALTVTLLSRFGSKVVLPSTGILMNNGLMWFNPSVGTSNSIRPSGQPLANMCPVIGTKEGQPHLAIGAAGGRQIMPAIVQILSYLFDFEMTLEDAFHHPRVSAEQEPVRCNTTMKPNHIASLARQFAVTQVEDSVYPIQFAVPSAILHDQKTGENYGMAHVNSPWSAAIAAPLTPQK